MKQQRLWLLCALFSVHFSAAAEQVMYVQSAKANLMAGPGFDTQLVSVLQKGASVTLVESQGEKDHNRWVQVNYQSSRGWMSTLLLAKQPPMEKMSILKGKHEQLEKSTRQRASASVTAAATRGLRNDERTRMSDAGKPDYNELHEMEAVEIKEAEVRKFHEEGLTQ
jgi:uncharacterized protein YgiM (DUF1202 family)